MLGEGNEILNYKNCPQGEKRVTAPESGGTSHMRHRIVCDISYGVVWYAVCVCV